MADKIKKFFECYIPVTVCNLRCDYCYVTQYKWKKGLMPKLKYSPERIARAFSRERLGGACYFSICGGGETLLASEVVDIAVKLLEEGHFVNITTNGTITKNIQSLISRLPEEALSRLHFAISLHYLELKRLNLLDVYAKNVEKIRAAGCSIVIQMNLYDGYLPFIDEIKEYSLKHFGALPQLAATREESDGCKLHTKLSKDEYLKVGQQFHSPLFEFTMRNFNVKRCEYCYAGAWSYTADLADGWVRPCYCNGEPVDVFQDITKPFPVEPVGEKCRHSFCTNSSHFMSLGVIPEMYGDISYADLRNRPEANWYTDRMREFLSSKLCESNQTYTPFQKALISSRIYCRSLSVRVVNKVARTIWGKNLMSRIYPKKK